MKKTILVLSLLLLSVSISYAQTGKKTSLIVSNCDEGGSGCATQHVYRYNFVNGEFVDKDRLLTADQESGVRFDLYNNQIYRNRYLINGSGDVVDLATQKIVHESKGELVEIDGDNVVIKVSRIDVEGIFFYNLQSGQYTRLKSPNVYELEGVWSPDKKYIASRVSSKGLIFTEIKTGRKKVVKGLFGVGLSDVASEFAKLPILWLDNARVLTQNSNGDLRIVDTNGKVERVVEIPLKTLPYRSPELFRNANGEIIYSSDDSFVIDVENKRFTPYKSYPLGGGFLSKEEEPLINNFGRVSFYYYEKNEIGKVWSGGARTTNGFIAMTYGKEGSNLGYPDGFKVWNNIKRDWTTIENKHLPQIIGWISE